MIRPVDLIEVDVVGAEVLQAAIAGSLYICRREVGGADLGCDDRLLAAAGQALAKHLLGFACAVALGGVEEVDSGVERGVYGGDGVAVVLLAPDIAACEGPAAESEGRDFDVRVAELPVVQGVVLRANVVVKAKFSAAKCGAVPIRMTRWCK